METDPKKILEQHSKDFAALYELYAGYNAHTNISAIKSRSDVYDKHFEDSLEAITLMYTLGADEIKVLDVGSGGGFPTLPLAIAFREMPNYKFYALDSVGKKTKFIELVKEQFNLQNVFTINARAEDKAHDHDFRETFDFVTARAVAELRMLIEICVPFVKIGGAVLAYKNRDNGPEMNAAQNALYELQADIAEEKIYNDRKILYITKLESTRTMYPRPFAQIKKNPL